MINIARPDLLFSLVWGAILLLLIYVPIGYVVDVENNLLVLISANILFGWLAFFLLNRHKLKANKINIARAYEIVRLLFIFWLLLYFFCIVYSGGAPFFWRISGDSRSYQDFGIPSLSGFLISIRNFLCVLCMYMWQIHKNKKCQYIIIIIISISTLELSRSNLFQLFFFIIPIYLLKMKEIKLKNIFIIFFIIILILGTFFVFFQLRGVEDNASLSVIYGGEPVEEYGESFLWLYSYLVSPVFNISRAISDGYSPQYEPLFMFMGMLPSIIRPEIFDVPPLPLVVSSLTATSAYAPMYADFGLLGAFILMLGIQFFAAKTFIMAKNGYFLGWMLYPVFFTSICLSLFYNYLFTTIAFSYIFLALTINRFIVDKK